MRSGTIIRLLASDKRFDCAHEGQLAKVWRVLPNGFYVELRCGHPWTMPSDFPFEIVEEPEEEKDMGRKPKATAESVAGAPPAPEIKQAVVPDGKGVIPVQGFETQVKRFKTNYNFHAQLLQMVEEDKKFFRGLAKSVLDKTEGDVRRVEFLAEDGSAVPVSLVDSDKTGNRTTIGAEEMKELMKFGVDLNELGVTETDTSFVLTGDFVEWMRGIIHTNYVSQGKTVPEAIQERTVVRLSQDGISRLRALTTQGATENERKAAEYLLLVGIKAALVTVR